MKTPLVRLCALLACIIPATCPAAKPDDLLVARWTFNRSSLASDVGAFRFTALEHGVGPEYTYENGAIRIGPGCLLVCDTLNSVNNEALGTSVTLWARVKVEQPFTGVAFSLGLRRVTEPCDWQGLVFTTLHRPAPQHPTGFFTRLADGDELGSGSRQLHLEAGRFVVMALVFDGNAGEIRYVVDGHEISKRTTATSLAPFTNFSLGRLKESGGNATLLFDEVRVYWGALPMELINEITPVTAK